MSARNESGKLLVHIQFVLGMLVLGGIILSLLAIAAIGEPNVPSDGPEVTAFFGLTMVAVGVVPMMWLRRQNR